MSDEKLDKSVEEDTSINISWSTQFVLRVDYCNWKNTSWILAEYGYGY